MKQSVNRLALAAAQVALALAGTMAAGTTSAQVAGLYQGVTSQGQLIEIQLIEDGIGTLVFSGGTVFWQATCTRSGPGARWPGASAPARRWTVSR
jgi:xanthine/uracil permease